jgi:CheY-like chemotaxis protein
VTREITTSSAASWTLAHRRVLVVEDEYFIADDMARALQKLGAEVVGPVPTRDKALALVEAGRVDAAVLDINLRGQTVFPVADALRERGVPFVFATGYDPSTVPAEYQDVPRWEKPFDPQVLAKMLPSVVHAS